MLSTDFDERFNHRAQNAALDRAVERRLAHQPRYGIVRAVVGSEHLVDSVWDRKTNTFTPVGEIVTALFAAIGLEAAR
ncbi:hypothetical protein [Caudoviricetes sp.]|nr:hypothetical protein [Caudoviricetes sp.]